jgi:RNA polymerase sigma-70 factor (ECF subfamily)
MNTLVKRAQRGDAEAFISLMEECKMSFRRIAFGYLGNDEDAADAIQDTILDAFEHIGTLRKAEYFKTWVMRILINNCTRTYRRNKKSVTLKENVEIEGYDTGRADVEFKEMLMSLPEDSRPIFQLYFGEQFTTKEIAEILSLKENTVKSRIHRGKEQLRMSLLQE